MGQRDPAGSTIAAVDAGAPGLDEAEVAVTIARAREDPLAFAPLYRQLFPAVYGYCARRLGDPEEAADATAQTFTRALAALPRFQPDPARPGATFRSWLFAIAHNAVVDAERRRGRDPRRLDPFADPDTSDHLRRLADAGPSPEEWAVAADEARRLRALLHQLSDGQRRVVELRLAGLTGAEIATSLDMRIGAVKSTQFRAYARLRTLLGETGGIE